VQRVDRRCRALLDRVGDTDQPSGAAVDRHEHDGLAATSQVVGVRLHQPDGNGQRLEQFQIADRHSTSVDRAHHTLASDRFEIADGRQRHAAFARPRDNSRGERMFADVLQARGKLEQLTLVRAILRRQRDEAWPPFAQGSGLVDHERGDLLEDLERFGVSNQHAGFGPPAGSDHDGHRRGEAKGTWARNDQDRDRVDQRVRKPRLGPELRPHDERNHRHDDHDRNEPRRDGIGQTLNRRPRALRLTDHTHDLGEQRIAADALSAHHELTSGVDRAPCHLAAG
jgi:hypothetical protein